MDTSEHNLSTLFKQLGLPQGEREQTQFLKEHSPLDADILLADAPFWSTAQSVFLREAISDDSDWAEAADHLDAMLRG